MRNLSKCWLVGLSLALLTWPTAMQAQKRNAKPRVILNSEIAKAVDELIKATPLTPPNEDTESASASADETLKPPADDAPLKKLLAFWNEADSDSELKPTPVVVERLLTAIEARPWLLNNLLNVLRNETATHDRLYQLWQSHQSEEDSWSRALREWLQTHSIYFREELLQTARQPGGTQSSAIETLAKLDWAAAEPLLANLDPTSRLCLSYTHAVKNGDMAQSESLRRQLQELVTQQPDHQARSSALSVLLEHDWPGREAWYASLFADASITGMEDSLPTETKLSAITENNVVRKESNAVEENVSLQGQSLTFELISPLQRWPEKFIPVVIELVNNSNPIIHEGAVNILCAFLNRDAVRAAAKIMNPFLQEAARPLIPWLTQPEWAHGERRTFLLASLNKLKIPEALPGLLWILDHDEDPELRATAAEALLAYRTPAAAPALRRALERESREEGRTKFVEALYECGGISDEEAAMALEAYARKMIAPGGESEIREAAEGIIYNEVLPKPLPFPVSIGRIIHESETLRATEGGTARLFERIRQVRRTNPALAKQLLAIIQNVPLALADQFFAERLAEGWLDADGLMLALERQGTMQKHAGDALSRLAYGEGYAAGVAVALLNNQERAAQLLKGQDRAAQKALLAAARYLRSSLPVAEVGALLKEKSLADFAESYLITEDSRAARELVLARHPNEALILGASLSELSIENYPDAGIKKFANRENQFREELKMSNAPHTIYCVMNESDRQTMEIRVWQDRAELRVYEDAMHWRSRGLTLNEMAELQALTARPEIEDLGPENWEPSSDMDVFEFVRVSLSGGRRFQLEELRGALRDATLHETLAGFFVRLRRAGDYEWHFALEQKFPGLKLVSHKSQFSMGLCQQDEQMLVLYRDVNSIISLRDTLAWHYLTADGIGKQADNVQGCNAAELQRLSSEVNALRNEHFFAKSERQKREKLFTTAFVLSGNGFTYPQWERLLEVRQQTGEAYVAGIATPDENWMVLLKQTGGEETLDSSGEYEMVRYNLKTRQTYTIYKAPTHWRPIAWIAAHQKMLLADSPGRYVSPTASFVLLDPVTGVTQPVKGEFRPFLEKDNLRTLQPTSKPHEFWAVIADDPQKPFTRIGRYNTKTFSFTPLIQLPDLQISSANFWIDETKEQLWLIYKDSSILRLPITGKLK